jgi:hypothetical protein
MITTPTKTEELEGLRALIDKLGPDSYLGPWLLDAFDHLEANIRADIPPLNAMDQYRIATRQRLDTEAACRQMRDEARLTLDQAHAQAGAITGKARIEADDIRGRAWSALNQCLKQLQN